VSRPALNHRAQLRSLAREALYQRGLEPFFSDAALHEVDQLGGPAPVDDPELVDLRALPWCSIDNDDSRDLDQLTVAERDAGGGALVRVAVADVDALVRRGSALDRQAEINTTSIYTPARTFPMLPEQLSTDWTSLNPGTDRAALVTEMVVSVDGHVRDAAVRRAAVRNHAQLAYPSVARWLEGDGPLPEAAAAVGGLAEQLRLQDEVAHALRQRRQEQGALDLDTLEPRAVFEGDAIVDFVARPRDRAQALIEDFMIAANGVAARRLDAAGLPTFRRVVRVPERWGRLREIADEHGDTLPREPDSRALNGFLVRRRRADPLRFPDLSLVVIKLLGSGEYVVQGPGRGDLGHFGLAVRDYMHSTAPNRRHPDLIAQRLLKAALRDQPSPYGLPELESLAEHCTRQEDVVNKVERQLRKSAAALLLESRLGERFDAVVTGVTDSRTWVRILKPPAEGLLARGAHGLSVGKRLRVELIATDAGRGWIDFARSS
jgi:exoribonuclease-2